MTDTTKINEAVNQWMQHQDMSRAEDVLDAMSGICWHWVNKQKKICESRQIPIEDLFAETQLEVLRTLKRFDPEVSNNFASYATTWIRVSISNYIKKTSVVCFGEGKARRNLMYNYKKMVEQIKEDHGEHLPTQEINSLISQETGYPLADIEAIWFEQNRGAHSMDESPGGVDGDGTLHERIAGEEDPEARYIQKIEKQAFRGVVQDFCEDLSLAEADIVQSRIATSDDEPATLDRLGNRWDRHRESVRQVETTLSRRLVRYAQKRFGISELEATGA